MGDGIRWFVCFLIDLLWLELQTEQLILLIDEPATPLHPGAQRIVAKMIGDVSHIYQVVYSTHSPFMIDWNFPQRVRLLVRDHESRRTHINNKPYAANSGERIWDPLRQATGVTVGDIAVVSEKNIFIEGISDQILLANYARILRITGRANLDLATVALLPYSDRMGLEAIDHQARRLAGKRVVLVDDDEQGAECEKYCKKRSLPCLTVRAFVDRIGIGKSSIEDVVGLPDYLVAVNSFYADFDWFKPITVADVAENGSFGVVPLLNLLFTQRWDRKLDKVGVAIELSSRIEDASEVSAERFRRLIQALLDTLENQP